MIVRPRGPEALAPVDEALEKGGQSVKIDGCGQQHQGGGLEQGEEFLGLVVAPGQHAGMGRPGAGPAADTGRDPVPAQRLKAYFGPGLGRAFGKKAGQAVGNAAGPGTAQERQNLVHAGNSPQKGLFLRSSPMLVAGPWPG